MRAAIMFDSAEEDSAANHPEICGQDIYLYALETFYTQAEIDCIFYLCEYREALSHMDRHISELKKKYGIDKPVRVFYGIRHLTQLWLHILQAEDERPDLYVFQDVRFPLVTGKMIKDTVTMAEKYGISMLSEKTEDPLFRANNGKIEVLHDTKFLKYPVSVRAGHPALHCLDKKERVLEELSYYEPHLCACYDENISVYNREDTEKAAVILQSRRLEIPEVETNKETEAGKKEQMISQTEAIEQRKNVVTAPGGVAV